MIEPKKQDFTLYQGATWEHTFVVLDGETGLPVDVTDCTATLQAREDVDDTVPVLNLTGEVGDSDGLIKFTVEPDMTVGEVWSAAGYDAELAWPSPSTKVDKLGFGKFKLVREFTRETAP